MSMNKRKFHVVSFSFLHTICFYRKNYVIRVQLIFCLFLEYPDDSPQLFREVTERRRIRDRVALER